jgi:uncharacterized protein (TIGR04551 family)
MSRLAAALAAALLVSTAARAQDAARKPDDLDPKTRAAIDRAVEKAKEDLRNEVRAEMQGAQSASEFLGTVAEGPKLQFLQLDGYFRTRGQLAYDLDLSVGRDASGRYYYPIPLDSTGGRHSITSANMRLRLEPTMNISEHVRVRAQVDVLDNYVYGSNPSSLYNDPSTPATFYGNGPVLTRNGNTQDRPAITPKRVWAEVQTPVGLLSFGRMPSEWGLGIFTNAGRGLDEDFGDTVDRMQFALPPVSTPIGKLTFVPILDFDKTGPIYTQPYAPTGVGQPFNAETGGNGRTYALKVARIDTEDEIRRKLERNEGSLNFGLYYNYRSQPWLYPEWEQSGFDAGYSSSTVQPIPAARRSAYAHIVDLWVRWLSARWKVEGELTGVYGSVGNANVTGDSALDTGKTLLRQWGGALVVDYKQIPNKLTWGVETGIASGDDAPGFGNVPNLGSQPSGSLEGAQWSPGTDRSIRNFRFNPAYRVDLILFHQILGNVTDAFYLKPKLRWDILPSLYLDAALVYSRALSLASTPSHQNGGGTRNLGLEADFQLNYGSGDGFHAWMQYGVLQPLNGLATAGPDGGTMRNPSRAQLLAIGVATKF